MSQGINNDMAANKPRRVVKNLRWWMLILFLLGVTVNYITRNSLGILAPELKSNLGITTEQYSWIVGAFQLAYTLFQPLCGWLIDVIGLKLGFMICAGLWALACLLHAGAGSWLQLAILRFFMGGAEAAATPANAKTIGEWFPKSERPIASGWAGVGFSIGAMLAPPIIYVAHASFGWQGAFMFTGVLAMLWVVLWWIFYNTPDNHPNLSQSELDYIHQDKEAPAIKLPFLAALKTVARNKRFYGIAIPAFMAEPAWAVLSFWVPLYLSKELGMDLKQIAMFAWLPFLAADLGSVASGYLTRLYTRIFGCTRINSVVASSVTGAFLMISLAIVAFTKSPYITIILISIGGFGHQIISCMLSALVVESFDKGQMATVNGMRGSAAWIASFLFSLMIGVTADKIGFNPLFIAMGFFDLIGAFFLVTFIAERRAQRA
ncbi:TPA_asm: MFS transporter [Salmonella enterica subsp. houtenae serovar 16:z4,z32:-]|uniref:MFS transporter n=1 Tax=Salmonella enterica subsp. houtenae serovar 16:z4,z32:- TaxID=1307497 RepID=A0A735P4K1_SALHO|nr:MFS transporter [Salmonella enterica]EDQ6564120.1 MFS transporter [Salmonella enterica subsp. houtenae]EDS7537610.1 MFS transporter [Salmonella enterica subsp. enterica]EGI6407526.1 MFS transporter [Salmonella enterica subsp. houtenae serovar 16:z4,z32:-]ENZ87678.1 Hexuronate transporter [Salmonella enterica subsp. houtenae serovar 16:z4,z32:-- str. RKS3027]QGF85802.1 MFS transporter [Salmonella enterica subsp. houtenae str. CFSAN000552]